MNIWEEFVEWLKPKPHQCVEYGNQTGLPQATCCECGAYTRHADFKRLGVDPKLIGVPNPKNAGTSWSK
jgi:hypothetical protein